MAGTTESEELLHNLCTNTFFSFWSYANLFTDRGRSPEAASTTDGKELCDVLIVFGRHVVIFSDKSCEFPNSGNVEQDWKRWKRRAITKSNDQAQGAKRWLRKHPNRVFMDRACQVPFPCNLPTGEEAIYHVVLVAHGASERAAQYYSADRGSLMVTVDSPIPMPFQVEYKPEEPAHVLDTITLPILLAHLTTPTDFFDYLRFKEELLRRPQAAMIAGEEELLGYYLLASRQDRSSLIERTNSVDGIFGIDVGEWARYERSPIRRRNLRSEWDSRIIDRFVESLAARLRDGLLQVFAGDLPDELEEAEATYSFDQALVPLVSEPRHRRAVLGRSLLHLVNSVSRKKQGAIVVASHWPNVAYVFVVAPRGRKPEEEYIQDRLDACRAYSTVARSEDASREFILCVGLESGLPKNMTETVMFFEFGNWSKEMADRATEYRDQFGSLTPPPVRRRAPPPSSRRRGSKRRRRGPKK